MVIQTNFLQNLYEILIKMSIINNLTFQFKMPKRNCRKYSQKNKKESSEQEKKYREKEICKWECRICHSLNDDCNPYCIQCYMGLHYYTYINMHMFVACDTSYEEIYYPTKHLETSLDSISLQSNQSECDSQHDASDLKIDWVQNLLKGQ